MSEHPGGLPAEHILTICAYHFRVSVDELRLRRRHGRIVPARHLTCAVLERCGYHPSGIARLLGCDPSTVLNSLARAGDLRRGEWADQWAAAVEAVREWGPIVAPPRRTWRRLTDDERARIRGLLAEGRPLSEVAALTGRSVETVRAYRPGERGAA